MNSKEFYLSFILLVFILLIIPLNGCGQTNQSSSSSSALSLSSSKSSQITVSSLSTSSQVLSNISSSSANAATSLVPVTSAVIAQANKLSTQAQYNYNALNYDAAIKLCDEAVSLDSSCYIAYNIKGIALCYQQKYSQGMLLIEKSLEISPNYAYGRFNMAMGYKLQKDLDNSLIWFNKALEVNPNDAWTFYGISTIYADKNDITNSLKYLKMAVDADPSVKPVAKRQDHFIKMRNNPEFIKIVS
jgi:tetratricopeptide (TPR) repeat protein